MKPRLIALVPALLAAPAVWAESTDPIMKVLELMAGMQEKLIKQGETSQKTYWEFSKWCKDRSRDLHHEIKVGKGQVANLKATIEEQADVITSAETKIGEVSAQLSTGEADIKAMTLLRKKEVEDYTAQERDLTDTIDMVQRSIAILQREMAKGAALTQMDGANAIAGVLATMVQATSLSADDADALAALIQSASGDASESEADEELDDATDAYGAPDPAVYQRRSGSIVETLQSLLDKSESALEAARSAETKRMQNFELLKQNLESKLTMLRGEMARAKKAKAQAGERKAAAQGELGVTTKDVDEDVKGLAEIHHKCMTRATEFSSETKSRGEELAALAKAKEVVKSATGGAAAQTYGAKKASLIEDQMAADTTDEDADAAPAFLSFLQAASEDDDQPPEFKLARAVRGLAKNTNSASLSQLSSKVDIAIRAATVSGDDPFAKVKDLITDMVKRLEDEARQDATQKAYCDKEMSETSAKKQSKDNELEDLSSKIDRLTAQSATLAEQISMLQAELSEIAKSQADLDRIRQSEKTAFEKNKPEMEQGISAIQSALKMLRDYYSQNDASSSDSGGAATGIIGMLEVVESDFSKGLAELSSEEESAVSAYKKTTQENEIRKATKETEMKYKSKNSKQVAKAAAELSQDRDGTITELAAVNEYLAKLRQECIAKPESYEERAKRRQQEIQGLREALASITGAPAASFLQAAATLHGRHHLRRHASLLAAW